MRSSWNMKERFENIMFSKILIYHIFIPTFQIHDLRLKQEKDLHLQRIRYEQELHQMKLAEFNKVQTASYPIMYK